MEILRLILLAAHFFGLAIIIGTFFVQMRRNEGWNFPILVTGGIIQLVSGIGMYGLAMAGGADLNHMKLGIKGIIALIVLVAAVIGLVQQRKAIAAGESERPAKKFFHMAGGLAAINVLIAVFWQS